MGRPTMMVACAYQLLAPAYKWGQTTREGYLPAGTDWYNYWTRKRLHGGQAIRGHAPTDTLLLFVRSGLIVPVGEPVLSAGKPQKIAKVQVYPGADARLDLYDDGVSYAYEKGDHHLVGTRWSDAEQKLT